MSNKIIRVFKKSVQRGRSERGPEAYPLGYVEGLSDARTKLAGFFNALLWTHGASGIRVPIVEQFGNRRMFSAERTIWVSADLDFSELSFAGIEVEQAVCQRPPNT